MRIIPKNTRVSMEIFKGVGLMDIIVGTMGVTILTLLFLADFTFKYWIMLFVFLVFVALLARFGEDANYVLLFNVIKNMTCKKKFSKETEDIKKLVAFSEILDDVISFKGKYFGGVIEILPAEFCFFDEIKQNDMIERVFGGVLRNLSFSESGNLVKIDRPINYDEYVKCALKKIDELNNIYKNGLLTEAEFLSRKKILDSRLDEIKSLNSNNKMIKAYHYLVIYDTDKESLKKQLKLIENLLNENGITSHILENKEIAVFLKYNYSLEVDESRINDIESKDYIDYILPDSINISNKYVKYKEENVYNLRIIDYPMLVTNAWGAKLFNIPDTKVTMKFRPVPQYKAIRRIDRAIEELQAQSEETKKMSKKLEISSHIDTLSNLLMLLQNDNETLFETNIYISVFERDGKNKEVLKNVKRILREDKFKIEDLSMQQYEGFLGNEVSSYDPFIKKSRSIHSTSLSAAFPFVNCIKADENGINLGESNGYPAFIDFFKLDKTRINSNLVVLGKSGSGKSYATKTILANLAAEDSKIFILDPENEYGVLAKKLGGKLIDVGSATEGRLNPFHIVSNIDFDDDTKNNNTAFSTHLQFLEEFFRQILPELDAESMERLNNLMIKVYMEKGIDETTDISKLKPSDFPTFDDVYDAILFEYQRAQGEYSKASLRTLMTFISKFATGGRNSNLWNGKATINTDENFVVFNFQSLLANKNNVIANAQMLLILKWLDNEIIKNRDYNIKNNSSRKIIIVIDEAHVFIDSKYPIALDFMFQLAKRIRKYNGMQIIITQNIRDFVGNEEITRKSTAIINACQYSFIFPLSPNDMNDLCKLYENSGGINEQEQHHIINNLRGQAFVISGSNPRSEIEVIALDEVKNMFLN